MIVDYRDMGKSVAAAHGLEPMLVLGIIATESGGRPAAWRPEPPYRYLWDIARGKPFRPLTAAEIASETPPPDFAAPNNVSRAAEWWGQQASWGLMQVMGGVAREHGFAGEFFTELCCDPLQGLDFGCRYLAACFRRFGALERAVAAYNGGTPVVVAGKFRNQKYVDDVLAAMALA